MNEWTLIYLVICSEPFSKSCAREKCVGVEGHTLNVIWKEKVHFLWAEDKTLAIYAHIVAN